MQTPAMALRWLPLLLVLAALLPGAGSAQALKGEVLSIGDGDTIRVRQAGKAMTVRLACIDAPEMAQRPYGGHVPQRIHLNTGVPAVNAHERQVNGSSLDTTCLSSPADLGGNSRSLCSLGHEPRAPPPAAAVVGSHPGQARPLLGLHPRLGVPALAAGERGGHNHWLETKKPLEVESEYKIKLKAVVESRRMPNYCSQRPKERFACCHREQIRRPSATRQARCVFQDRPVRREMGG